MIALLLKSDEVGIDENRPCDQQVSVRLIDTITLSVWWNWLLSASRNSEYQVWGMSMHHCGQIVDKQ